MDDPSVEEIDWFPLPEMDSTEDHAHSEKDPTPYAKSQFNPCQPPPPPPHCDRLHDLSVFSIKSNSTAVPSSPDPPSILTTPTQLDQLWAQFLDLYVSKSHPFITCNKDECTCTCHHDNDKPKPIKTEPFLFAPFQPKQLPDEPHPQIVSEDTPTITTGTESTRLTLQDACRHYKSSFIKNSMARQDAIKNKLRGWGISVTTPVSHTPSFTPGKNKSKILILPFFTFFPSPPLPLSGITDPNPFREARPKMSYKDMYMYSKRYEKMRRDTKHAHTFLLF